MKFDLNIRITLFTAIGMFLSMLDTGIVSISISHMSASLTGDPSLSPFILTSYSLLLCGTILIFGQLSTHYSSLFIFRWGLFLFLCTSILCALSWSMWSLIAFRSLQGISAAMLQATSLALISLYVVEEHKTKIISTVIALASMGPVVAPAVGGFIIENMSWEWMFYLNIPFCLVALMASANIASKTPRHSSGNYLNILSYTACILVFFIGVFLSKAVIFFSISAMLLIFSLYLDNKNQMDGVLINQHITHYKYYLTLLLFTALGLTSSCMFIITPIKLLVTHDVFTVSLTTMLLPIFTVIAAKLAAGLMRQFGHEAVCCSGILLMFIGTLGVFNAQFTLPIAILCMLSFGVGGGLFQPANTLLLFNSSQINYHGMSNAISRLCVNLGIALGSAFVATFYIEKII